MGNCMSATAGGYEVATTQQDLMSNLALDDNIWFKILAYTDSATVGRVKALSDEMRGVVDRLPDDYVAQINVNNPQDKVDSYQKMMLFAYDGTDGRHVDAGYLYSLLNNPNTPGAILSQIMGMPHGQDARYVLEVVARHPNTTGATLHELLKYYDPDALDPIDDYDVRFDVAFHPNTTTATLNKLLEYQNGSLRRAVARHPNLSDAAYKLLLHEGLQNFLENRINYILLAALASNTSAKPDYLKELGRHGLRVDLEGLELSSNLESSQLVNHPDILKAVASNPSTPFDTLAEMLHQDRLASVSILSIYYSMPSDIQRRMREKLHDVGLYLRIASNPSWPYGGAELFKDIITGQYDPRLPWELVEASNWHAPPQRLKKLATHSDVDVRRAVASNQNTPPKTLIRLALNDLDSLVRQNALVNPNLSCKVVDALILKGEMSQREGAQNPNTSVNRLMWLANIPYTEQPPTRLRDVWNICLKDEPAELAEPPEKDTWSVISAVISNQNMPFEFAARLSRSDDGSPKLFWPS